MDLWCSGGCRGGDASGLGWTTVGLNIHIVQTAEVGGAWPGLAWCLVPAPEQLRRRGRGSAYVWQCGQNCHRQTPWLCRRCFVSAQMQALAHGDGGGV